MHKDTFYFLHIHANAYFILLALIVSTLTGVRCYLMVLVCIFLMMCNVEHIFMCSYWPFVHLLFAFYLENLYAENITQSARLDEYNLLLLLLLSRFSLQCMKVKSESEVAQSSPTLSDPMDCSLPGSSFHGIFQARVLEWHAIAFSRITTWKRNINNLRHADDTTLSE